MSFHYISFILFFTNNNNLVHWKFSFQSSPLLQVTAVAMFLPYASPIV